MSDFHVSGIIVVLINCYILKLSVLLGQEHEIIFITIVIINDSSLYSFIGAATASVVGLLSTTQTHFHPRHFYNIVEVSLRYPRPRV